MSGKIPARPMEYPYTLVSKVTHFPHKVFWNHANWRIKWGIIGYIVCMPFFISMHRALNGPGNQEKLKLYKAKEHKEHIEHMAHLK